MKNPNRCGVCGGTELVDDVDNDGRPYKGCVRCMIVINESLPEDAEIRAAHPLRTGRHDLYAEAMRLVGARHTKAALVDLVNWLLHRIENH